MGFPRQEYWNGLPFPSPGDLPDPGTEPASPALQADSLPLSHLGSQEGYLPLFSGLGEKKRFIAPENLTVIWNSNFSVRVTYLLLWLF